MHIWFGSPSIQLENGISLGLGGYILVYGPIVVNVLILSIVTHHIPFEFPQGYLPKQNLTSIVVHMTSKVLRVLMRLINVVKKKKKKKKKKR
jgi:hypothetical protein